LTQVYAAGFFCSAKKAQTHFFTFFSSQNGKITYHAEQSRAPIAEVNLSHFDETGLSGEPKPPWKSQNYK
jgi:hypothetical protein